VADIRDFVEQHLDALPSDPERAARLREALDLALGQSRSVWRTVACKHCGRQGKYEVDFPNPAAVARALRDLIEVTKGKPAQEIAVSHTHELLPVRDLTTEELLRLASREVVDGEFEEVGAGELSAAGGSD